MVWMLTNLCLTYPPLHQALCPDNMQQFSYLQKSSYLTKISSTRFPHLYRFFHLPLFLYMFFLPRCFSSSCHLHSFFLVMFCVEDEWKCYVVMEGEENYQRRMKRKRNSSRLHCLIHSCVHKVWRSTRVYFISQHQEQVTGEATDECGRKALVRSVRRAMLRPTKM